MLKQVRERELHAGKRCEHSNGERGALAIPSLRQLWEEGDTILPMGMEGLLEGHFVEF
jgi:hypothetical protein